MAKTPSTPNVKKTETAAKAAARPSLSKKAASKKAVPKKVTLKAAAPKKAVAKKTAPNVAAKKASPKNTAPKKVTPPKQSAAKTPPNKSVAPTTLQAQVDHVAKRLSAADSRTKKNITALETEFGALAKQMGRTKAGQTRLTRRVTELSKTLSADLDNLQSDIRRELASVLQNPTLTELQAALERADHRLTESESAQDTAIARINRHIADIATIVEHRLSDEAHARESAMAEMKALMGENKSQLLATQAAFKAKARMPSVALAIRLSM